MIEERDDPEQQAEDAAAEEPAEPAAGQPDQAAEGPDEGAAADAEPVAEPDAPPESEPSEDASSEESKPDEPPSDEAPAEAPKAAPGAELEPIQLEPDRELSAEERARLEAEAEERARLEAAATAEGGEEPVARREPRVELESGRQIQATGKRKSSIARVILRSGSGGVEVNKRALEEYFPRRSHQTVVRQPLVTSGYEGTVDVAVSVHGGGIAGQAGAVRHGIARALTEIDPDLRGELKRRGLLTRDARRKERRKAGLKKARKRPQFSKR
jgi:small subunit ribosomal protein S9